MGPQVDPLISVMHENILKAGCDLSIGTIAAVGKGFFRIMKINADLVSDIIPVDYPINLMIAAAWHTATRR